MDKLRPLYENIHIYGMRDPIGSVRDCQLGKEVVDNYIK